MLGTGDARVRVCGSCGCEVTLCRSLEESCDLIRRSPMARMACAPEHFVEEIAISYVPEWMRQRLGQKLPSHTRERKSSR
ncbi:MAG: hypothetical protein R3E52_11760 [Burkholderiaceae bacterium]